MGKGKVANLDKYKRKKCVIGIDQSYKRTGISIAVDGEIKKISYIDFKNVKTKSAKRIKLRKTLKKAILICIKKYGDDVSIIFERIRTFTQRDILNPGYIKDTGALCSVIIDTAFEFGLEAWSADTRAWKNGVLGTSKPCVEPFPGVKDPRKILEVKYIIGLGFEEEITLRRGNNHFFVGYNDDAADSACIALYGFVDKPKLKKEF